MIFPFLNSFKATFITALAIPLSLLGTFIVMATASFNLETITLLALALVIGIVVDDAIVEVENISRHISEGETPKQAALKGSDEIGLTVSASTLTIVAVFLPVAFTTGNVKQFFSPLCFNCLYCRHGFPVGGSNSYARTLYVLVKICSQTGVR